MIYSYIVKCVNFKSLLVCLYLCWQFLKQFQISKIHLILYFINTDTVFNLYCRASNQYPIRGNTRAPPPKWAEKKVTNYLLYNSFVAFSINTPHNVKILKLPITMSKLTDYLWLTFLLEWYGGLLSFNYASFLMVFFIAKQLSKSKSIKIDLDFNAELFEPPHHW